MNHVVNKRNRRDRDIAVGGFRSINKLLMDNLEKEGTLAYRRARDALNVLIGIVCRCSHFEGKAFRSDLSSPNWFQ